MNKPYLESFLAPDQITLKYSRVRPKQKLRDNNHQQCRDDHVGGNVATSSDFQSSVYNTQKPHHRREQSMNSTVDPEIKRTRMQAHAERKVESCERPQKYLDFDGDEGDTYSIL